MFGGLTSCKFPIVYSTCAKNYANWLAVDKVIAKIRDVVLGLGPWSLVVLKDKIAVLGPGLGLEPSVLGPVLGLAC